MRFLRFLAFLFCIFFFENNNAQTYAKVNAMALPFGVFNAGMEAKISNKNTIETEVFISPWKSFLGHKLQIYSLNVEGRHYLTESFKHFYLGGNLGLAIFDLQKWNYIDSPKYQRGYTFLIGFTVGYQFQVRENLNLDIFLGGANSQGFYHGYYIDKGVRYEDGNPWNRSGEWIPYKGGIMVSYKLK